MNGQAGQAGFDAREALQRLVSELPESPGELLAARERVLAAAAAFEPSRDPLATALAECVASLRARATALRRATTPVATGTEPLPELSFHHRGTAAVPPVQAPAEAPPPKAQAVHWTPEDRLLYDDVMNLFELGDQVGGMTSLERLIMISPHAEELTAFIDKNGPALIRLYHEHLGSLERVPVPVKGGHPVKIPTAHPPLVLDLLRLADGHRTIRDILKRSKLGELQTLASVAHLARSGFLELA